MTASRQDCLICTEAKKPPYFVMETKHWRIRHSKETRIAAYCILEPARHFLDLSEASASELAEYGKVLGALMKAQKQLVKPERIYTFSLAEAVAHYHLHLIPRDKDFIAAYKGRGIMSYPLEPVLDQNLLESAVESLRALLRRSLS